jgi:hypothetical protein
MHSPKEPSPPTQARETKARSLVGHSRRCRSHAPHSCQAGRLVRQQGCTYNWHNDQRATHTNHSVLFRLRCSHKGSTRTQNRLWSHTGCSLDIANAGSPRPMWPVVTVVALVSAHAYVPADVNAEVAADGTQVCDERIGLSDELSCPSYNPLALPYLLSIIHARIVVFKQSLDRLGQRAQPSGTIATTGPDARNRTSFGKKCRPLCSA